MWKRLLKIMFYRIQKTEAPMIETPMTEVLKIEAPIIEVPIIEHT